MNGRLAPGTLPGLLRELYVGRKTGVLRLASGDVQRALRFRAGELVHATSTLPTERLGETLVREGLLCQADLDRAGELVRLDGVRLGEALRRLGAIETAALETGMAAQVRDVLLAGFASEGAYEFQEQSGPGDEDADVTLLVSTGNVILDAVRRLRDPEVVRRGLGDLERRLGPATDPLLRFQRITLTPTEGYVHSRVDGTLNAREIATLAPLPAEDVLRSLLGLLSTGLVEHAAPAAKAHGRAATPAAPIVAEREAPAPDAQAEAAERRREILDLHAALAARNHFEILGVARDASEADVKAAYFRQARRFHPDVHHAPALADLRDKLEAIFIRLGQAYEVLKNTQTRRSYEARLPRVTPESPAPSAPVAPATGATPPPPTPPPVDPAAQVERALRQAERHLSAQEYWDAIQALEAAEPLAQGRALARLRLLLAKALLKNPHWVRRAEETLLALVKDAPQHVEAHFLLGGIYKNGGLRARAASMLRKVVELDPSHEEAAAQLAELAPATPPEPAPPPDKPGLLKKLFGRQ
jgi:tetratricopeptide (TPR) repeat protein